MWVLIVNLIKFSDQLNHPHMTQISFCLCLKHLELLPFAVCYDKLVENQITILFYL